MASRTTNETHQSESVQIESLLQEHYPSDLDYLLKRPCPSYIDSDDDLTSAYGALHNAVQSRLLVQLQLNLERLRIQGETGKAGYRLDGVADIEIKDGTAEVMGEDKSVSLAVIEVKTGNIKPVQAAAYAHWEEVPVLIAEVVTGDVHVVDEQTAEILLDELATHEEEKRVLSAREKLIPGRFQCGSCARKDCPHYRESRSNEKNIIAEKAGCFANIPVVVEQLIQELHSIAEDCGYSVSDTDEAPGTVQTGATK